MEYRVEIRITPRMGLLDPQGKAVGGALNSLGFTRITEVHVGRLIVLGLGASDEHEAQENATAMCRQLLSNPVTEDFDVRVSEAAAR
ncbi:phosphoribosylformylglycinamidine synthase subunit PurS [soil metagenome]